MTWNSRILGLSDVAKFVWCWLFVITPLLTLQSYMMFRVESSLQPSSYFSSVAIYDSGSIRITTSTCSNSAVMKKHTWWHIHGDMLVTLRLEFLCHKGQTDQSWCTLDFEAWRSTLWIYPLPFQNRTAEVNVVGEDRSAGEGQCWSSQQRQWGLWGRFTFTAHWHWQHLKCTEGVSAVLRALVWYWAVG